MTSGQMLLAGFNGLFTKVASELTDMFAAFEQVHFDKHELKFDIVRDAKDLQVKTLFALSLPCVLLSNPCLFVCLLVYFAKFT